LPDESTAPVDTDRYQLLARFVHISDAQITDEESPGRLTSAAIASASAWRPHEAYSAQLLDGFVRTVNKLHVAKHPIDFVIHTGDAMDNAQFNELTWFMTVLDGGLVDPLSGRDDRDPASLPDPLLDPHHPFDAQGLYRSGVHGPASTIGWYGLLGNHDRFAVGVFPIVTDPLGRRVSPLPLARRIALTFPAVLNPTGSTSWAPVTPANPGPPPVISLPVRIEANPDRRFITDLEFIQAHLESNGDPSGHGFDTDDPTRTWYSVSPLPGLRLIGLNSATPLIETPTLVYSEGAISLPQLRFLQRELAQAQAVDECVIVATHHPSDSLEPIYGTALTPESFRQLLNLYPCVKLHIAGHWHGHATLDQGGYVEIVTGSTLDRPQQGRVIEVWQAVEPQADTPANGVLDGSPIELRYRFFSHLDEVDPSDEAHAAMFEDPLMPMRRIAAELAHTR
jgi:3',5'-cyclic AMP phosphodiesterase CpdA